MVEVAAGVQRLGVVRVLEVEELQLGANVVGVAGEGFPKDVLEMLPFSRVTGSSFAHSFSGAGLIFFMQAGFAMVEAGFTRAKNAINIIMKNLQKKQKMIKKKLLIISITIYMLMKTQLTQFMNIFMNSTIMLKYHMKKDC